MTNQTSSKLTVAPATLLAVALLLLAGGGWLCWRQFQQRPVEVVAPVAPAMALSETTQRILASLTTPIEVSFFAPDQAVALPENLRSYIARVTQLLAEYERAAAGKLRVRQRDPQTDAAAKKAAVTAGIVPFASETGEIVYLGLTVGNGTRTETIAPLAPEWEAALESDLSRAIQRLLARAPSTTTARITARQDVQPAPIDPVMSEQLLKMFPDYQTRSYDEMAHELRTAALEEFKIATAEMQAKVSVAQQTLAEAQAKKGAAEPEEALKDFQRVQAEQADKLKGITAWLQERLTALQQLKAAPGLPAPARSVLDRLNTADN